MAVAVPIIPKVTVKPRARARYVSGIRLGLNRRTKSVVTASEEDSLEEVITKMLENRVHRIPVIRGGVPVGMISRHDLLKLVAKHITQSK